MLKVQEVSVTKRSKGPDFERLVSRCKDMFRHVSSYILKVNRDIGFSIFLLSVFFYTFSPDMEEAADIHRVFLSTLDTTQHSFNNRNIAKGAKWMSECKTKSILVAMPEHRNIHGKLFGGHIMRKAFELAYSNMRLAFGANCIAVASLRSNATPQNE